MNKEIKNILDKVTPYLFGDEVDKLLNYINNLEKCYCNRTDCSARIDMLNKKYDSLQQKLDSIKFYIEQSDIKDMLWGKEILKMIGEDNG